MKTASVVIESANSWQKGAREKQHCPESVRAAVQGKTWWFAMSIRAVAPGAAKWPVSSRPGGEERSEGRAGTWGVPSPSCQLPHRRQHCRRRLGLSSEHPLSALNRRSHHTLRSGEGPPVSGQGKAERAGCHFVISWASKAGRHQEGGERSCGVTGGCEPLAQPPRGPAHLVHSCSGRKEPWESRGMEEVVWGKPRC